MQPSCNLLSSLGSGFNVFFFGRGLFGVLGKSQLIVFFNHCALSLIIWVSWEDLFELGNWLRGREPYISSLSTWAKLVFAFPSRPLDFEVFYNFYFVLFSSYVREFEEFIDFRHCKFRLDFFLKAPKLFLNIPIDILEATAFDVSHVEVHSFPISEGGNHWGVVTVTLLWKTANTQTSQGIFYSLRWWSSNWMALFRKIKNTWLLMLSWCGGFHNINGDKMCSWCIAYVLLTLWRVNGYIDANHGILFRGLSVRV